MAIDDEPPVRYGRVASRNHDKTTGRHLYWFLMHGPLPSVRRRLQPDERLGFLKGFQVVAESRADALRLVRDEGKVGEARVEDWDVVESDVPDPIGLMPSRPGHSVIWERDIE